MSTTVSFIGSIPRQYEDYLTSLLFDKFAQDLVTRTSIPQEGDILELAAGTGCLTQKLISNLPAATQLYATDLEPDMLEVAKSKINAANVQWMTVDMTAIPFGDNRFNTIISQFGLMLVPDRLKALQEMYRVLKPGGQLIFSVWGELSSNQIWQIGGEVISSFLGVNPITQDPGPFTMSSAETIAQMKEAGFIHPVATLVDTTGEASTAGIAAKGFIEGLPVYVAIRKKGEQLVEQITASLAKELKNKLGDAPMITKLQALVFTAEKSSDQRSL